LRWAATGEELLDALDRFGAGDWTVRSLPALAVRASGAPDDWAVNDLVVVRRGSGRIVAEVAVDTLRRRGLIADSPRVLARDDRGQQAVGRGQLP
jgi:hypothetical protein